MNQRFEAGQFISFTYNPPPRALPPQRPGMPLPPVSDRAKEVFVLHPNWRNQVHAIDLKGLTPAEQQVLKAIMDPNVRAQVDAGKWPVDGAPPYPLIRDILRRYDPTELIKVPMQFYAMFVKPFIRDKNVYRRYNTQYVFAVRVVQESNAKPGPIVNAAPLFKKI